MQTSSLSNPFVLVYGVVSEPCPTSLFIWSLFYKCKFFFWQLHSKHKAALHMQYALGSARPLEVSEAADEVSSILSRPYNSLVAPLTKTTRLSKLFLQLVVQSSNNTRNKKRRPSVLFFVWWIRVFPLCCCSTELCPSKTNLYNTRGYDRRIGAKTRV